MSNFYKTQTNHNHFEGPASTCDLLTDSKPFQPSSNVLNLAELADQILSNHDQLPIRTFYERFPWLCKRSLPEH